MHYETKYTQNIVCPCCGYEDMDSWEADFGLGLGGEEELQCGSCGEMFMANRDVEVTYSTWKKGDCHACDGRGELGAAHIGLDQVIVCKTCKGTGKKEQK